MVFLKALTLLFSNARLIRTVVCCQGYPSMSLSCLWGPIPCRTNAVDRFCCIGNCWQLPWNILSCGVLEQQKHHCWSGTRKRFAWNWILVYSFVIIINTYCCHLHFSKVMGPYLINSDNSYPVSTLLRNTIIYDVLFQSIRFLSLRWAWICFFYSIAPFIKVFVM